MMRLWVPSRAARVRSDSGSHASRMSTAISDVTPPKMNRPGQSKRGRMTVESGPEAATPKP